MYKKIVSHHSSGFNGYVGHTAARRQARAQEYLGQS